jgi:DNA-binding FrmR family transcriptional regulator
MVSGALWMIFTHADAFRTSGGSRSFAPNSEDRRGQSDSRERVRLEAIASVAALSQRSTRSACYAGNSPVAVPVSFIVYPPISYLGLATMTHTVREKSKLLGRVRRIRGQVEAIERALDEEIGCADVLQLIASVRGAINGLMAEVMEDHVRGHILAAENDAQRRHGSEELLDVIRAYLK